jgi:hypothetical protein
MPLQQELPDGFEHQPRYDRTFVEESGSVRVLRFFTRGSPEVATDEHASILLAVTIGASTERAAHEFSETVAGWGSKGYDLFAVDGAIGDTAVAGWDLLYASTDHPKEAALLHFRQGAVNATVQWTDDPGDVTLEHVLAIARLIEARCSLAPA